MSETSLISDDLLRQLVGVGQVDVLVGVPTLNHAETVGNIVAAVQRSFGTTFARQRTVLVNTDGGSTDATTAIVRDRSIESAETFTTSQRGLRTAHRITAPYHGVGIGKAVQQIFAIADLLQASTVVVLDPDVTNVSPDWVAALGTPVRDHGVDFVAPVFQRQALDAPLVTQLVRPLFGAVYGHRLAEPLIGEFGCSGRFAVRCLEAFEAEAAGSAAGPWLAGTALSNGCKACQAPLGTRIVSAARPRPALPALFHDVVVALFGAIETHDRYWLARSTVDDVPVVGALAPSAEGLSESGGSSPRPSFAGDVADLGSILQAILTPATLEALRHAAEASPAEYPDALWAATVTECLLAYHHHAIRRDHITQALLPLYRARAGMFVHDHASSDADALERSFTSLQAAFEAARRIAVERWTENGKG